MEPGTYQVSYTPYWNTSATRTDIVLVGTDGSHYIKSAGYFHKTARYGNGTLGFTWVKMGD